MRVMATTSYGPIEQLQSLDMADPTPGAGQVRVRVHAAALNPADFKVATGALKILHGRTFPMVVGYDFSGVVDQVGAGVSEAKLGHEVFGFLPYSRATRQGSFAEYLVTNQNALAQKPSRVSHSIAAASATPALTALQSLRDLGRLPSGGKALIIGASGGVGSLAIGVARKLGAEVTAVCGSDAFEYVKGLGAKEVLDRRQPDWAKSAQGAYDVILDAAGACTWSATRHLLARGGSYVTTLPGPSVFLHMFTSRFTSTRARMVLVRPKEDDFSLLATWLEEGLMVPLDMAIPVRDLVLGLKRMLGGNMRGRIAVEVLGGF